MTAYTDNLATLAREFIAPDVPGYIVSGEGIAGIFSRRYVESDRIAGYRPIFICVEQDASALTIGGNLTIDGNTYTIAERQPDGDGLLMLVLEK